MFARRIGNHGYCHRSQKVISNMADLMSTSDIDLLSANIAAQLITTHPKYGELAARISISNLHKETEENFSDVVIKLYNKKPKLVTQEFYELVLNNKKILDDNINYNNDYNFSYFGLKTLQRSYLLKIGDDIVERPQHMLMRVSIGLHMLNNNINISKAIQTDNLMSIGKFIHASPTLFNTATYLPN